MQLLVKKHCHRYFQARTSTWMLVAMMLCAACVQAQGDAVLTPMGGNGGNRFFARCAPGELLTGFDLRAGDDIDAIRPICVPTETGKFDFYPISFGGGGGGPRQLICPGDIPIVTGMSIGSEGKEIRTVNNIHLFCGTATAAQQASDVPSVGFDAPPEETSGIFGAFIDRQNDTQHCPSGLVAVGINGRSGNWLDAVGLICGAPPMTGQAETHKDDKPPVALGRVQAGAPAPTAPPLQAVGGEPPICARARDARARNSPVASSLEAQCQAAGGNFSDRAVARGMTSAIERNAAAMSHAGILASPHAAPSAAQPSPKPDHDFMPPNFMPPMFADGARLWACVNAAQGAAKGMSCRGLKPGRDFCRMQGLSGALQTGAGGAPAVTALPVRPGTRVRAINGDACTASECIAISELHCAP